MLPEILARDTRMPVKVAEHDQVVERDNVYVTPADALTSDSISKFAENGFVR